MEKFARFTPEPVIRPMFVLRRRAPQMLRLALVPALALGAAACQEEDDCARPIPACVGPQPPDATDDPDATDATSDTDDGDTDDGDDAGDTSPDVVPDACGVGDPGCEPVACVGVDEDGDGICDRKRADWSRDARVPRGTHRADIYILGDARNTIARRGIEHTLTWPIDISGALLPWRPMRELLDPNATADDRIALQNLVRRSLGFGTLPEMYAWLGLATAQLDHDPIPGVPWPEGIAEGDMLGAGIVNTAWGEALTYSCATCHTAELFGRTVYGLTNRRAQANEYFHSARTFFPSLRPSLFEAVTGADETEIELFLRTQEHLNAVGSRMPMARGLDTSLAQVSLSLARRGLDPNATRDPAIERAPRENLLSDYVSDSKPAVWWTLRYKTRWLSDGSIVQGNPIFTNFLWNELGRGTDLDELQAWLDNNMDLVDELTVAAFAAVAPRWEDWFGEDSIDLETAQRGEVLFEANCASCHGTYAKGWSLPDADALSTRERLATIRVDYHEQTPVLDVGTDPQRARGMEAFADRLNDLAVSQWMETVVEVQEGYVPPPLDGIWARYPYLHNHAVPTLCEMLLPAEHRTPVFWMGPDVDPETDFDMDCVGLPVGDRVPASWQAEPRNRMDTAIDGLRNVGHDEWLRDANGDPRFSDEQIQDLVAFLKTL